MPALHTDYRQPKKTPEQEQVAYYQQRTYTAPTVIIPPSKQVVREEPKHATGPIETLKLTTPVYKESYVPTQLFGPKTEYYDPATGMFKEQLGYGEKAPIVSVTKGVGFSPHESAAVSGLALGTTVATGVVSPKLGAFALGGVSAVEAAKYGITRKHLTPEEAIFVASAAESLGYGIMKVAPYVKMAYNKVTNVLSPERAMYNRVIASQQPPSPDVPFTERIIGKISPERALYQRITKPPPIQEMPKSDFLTGSGKTSQWVMQQVLVKQTPIQKTSMKPFLPLSDTAMLKAVTLTRTTIAPQTKTIAKTQQVPKTTTVQQQVMQRTAQQQVANPFLQFPGKPFYRQRSREQEEYAYLIYPSTSPLEAPTQITKPSVIQRQTTTPLIKSILEQSPTTTLDILEMQSQTTRQALDTKQVQRQVQEQTQMQQTQQEEMKRYLNLGGFDLTPGFNRISREVFGGYGRYKRKYPIMTPEQVLKEVLS